MSPSLDPIRHLYADALGGETPDEAAARADRLAHSPEARAETASLKPVRDALDAQPAPGPPASLVDAVVLAALVAHPGAAPARPALALGQRAADRPAARSRRARPHRRGVVALALLAVATTASLLWLQPATVAPLSAPVAAASDVESVLPPSAAASPLVGAVDAPRADAVALPPSARLTAPSFTIPDRGLAAPPEAESATAQARLAELVTAPAAAEPAEATEAPADEDLLAWNDGTDLAALQSRLETIKEQAADLEWDEPPVPLGAPAASDETARVGLDAPREPARNWMQVSLTTDLE